MAELQIVNQWKIVVTTPELRVINKALRESKDPAARQLSDMFMTQKTHVVDQMAHENKKLKENLTKEEPSAKGL